jgi:hypothetical protein
MGGRWPIEIWEGIPVYKKGDTRSRYGREYPFIRGKGNVRSEYGRKMPVRSIGGKWPFEIWEGMPVHNMGGRCAFEIWEEDARLKYGRKMPD